MSLNLVKLLLLVIIILIAAPVISLVSVKIYQYDVIPRPGNYLRYLIVIHTSRRLNVKVDVQYYLPGIGWSGWRRLWDGYLSGSRDLGSSIYIPSGIKAGSVVLQVCVLYTDDQVYTLVDGKHYYVERCYISVLGEIESEHKWLYEELVEEYNSLKNKYERLERAYKELEEKYEELKTEYFKLKERYHELIKGRKAKLILHAVVDRNKDDLYHLYVTEDDIIGVGKSLKVNFSIYGSPNTEYTIVVDTGWAIKIGDRAVRHFEFKVRTNEKGYAEDFIGFRNTDGVRSFYSEVLKTYDGNLRVVVKAVSLTGVEDEATLIIHVSPPKVDKQSE